MINDGGKKISTDAWTNATADWQQSLFIFLRSRMNNLRNNNFGWL